MKPIRIEINHGRVLHLSNMRSAEQEIIERKALGLLANDKIYVAVDERTNETRFCK